MERVWRLKPGASQAEIAADLSGAAVQKARRPDIGKQTDRGFRHREKGPFGSDAISAVDRDPGPTSHRDPVDDCDVGLGKAMDWTDKLVLFAKEDGRQVGITADPAPRRIDRAHVAAGAKGALAGAADHHSMDRWVRSPGAQCRIETAVVVEGQRIKRLRPVDRQDRQATVAVEQDLVRPAHPGGSSLRNRCELANRR